MIFCLSLLFGIIACNTMIRSHISRSLSAPGSLSVYKFSLRYPHKIGCLVMRIKQKVINNNLSKMKNKILLIRLQGNNRDSVPKSGKWKSRIAPGQLNKFPGHYFLKCNQWTKLEEYIIYTDIQRLSTA